MIHYISKRKDKNVIISIDAGKTCDKVHYLFMRKTLNKESLEGTNLNRI